MHTDLIFQFRAVMESGTVAGAAEQLGMTPGALSRAIKRLESELNCVLFVPSGRNIIPTREARVFYASSEGILRALEGARAALKEKDERARELRIATFEVFSTHFLSWMIQNPGIQDPVTALETTPGDIEKSIVGGVADFGLTYIPVLHPDLDHVVAGEMPLGVFAARHARNVDLPFAVPITDTGVNAMQISSLDGWPSDAHRVIRYRFEMLETALDLASRGGCRILCPRFIVRLENERLNQEHRLVEVSQKFRFPRLKVYAIKKKSEAEDVRFRSLCKAIRIALREP